MTEKLPTGGAWRLERSVDHEAASIVAEVHGIHCHYQYILSDAPAGDTEATGRLLVLAPRMKQKLMLLSNLLKIATVLMDADTRETVEVYLEETKELLAELSPEDDDSESGWTDRPDPQEGEVTQVHRAKDVD